LEDHDHAVALTQPLPACQYPPTELLMQVVQYIMERLHGDLSVSALARRFSLEEGVLLSAFQSHTGIALDQFVLRRRIERALHLLKHSNATDREIAMSVGWGSTPAFRATFASYLGASPTEYRASLYREQAATSSERRKRPCKTACVPRQESGARALRAVAP
jgi:transcriptional regulator GlxA family with amidase domain